MQTFFDVRHAGDQFSGLYCNMVPLRRPQAERMAEQERRKGYTVEIVPTRDALWEKTYGDKTPPR